MAKQEYMCERCGTKPAMKKIKYCKACKYEILREWQEEGYLRPIPRQGTSRPGGAMEKTQETKFGTGH